MASVSALGACGAMDLLANAFKLGRFGTVLSSLATLRSSAPNEPNEPNPKNASNSAYKSRSSAKRCQLRATAEASQQARGRASPQAEGEPAHKPASQRYTPLLAILMSQASQFHLQESARLTRFQAWSGVALALAWRGGASFRLGSCQRWR